MVNSTTIAIACGVAYISYHGLGAILSSFFRKQLTVLNELEHIGEARKDGSKIKGTVVIAGGSFGGLWTARICSDHVERVLVIDPDSWISTEDSDKNSSPGVKRVGEDMMRAPVNKRSHVAQYNCLHIWQVISLWACRKVFPNFDEQFQAGGGMIRVSRFSLLYSGIPHASFEHIFSPGTETLPWCSRAFFETFLRRSVKAVCKNVDFVTGSVVGINADPSNPSKIASVTYKLKESEEVQTQETLLFVDCAGSSHSGLKWLGEAGYGTTIKAQLPSGKLPLDKALITYNPKMVYSTTVWPVDAAQRAELERIIPGGYENQAWFFTYIAMPERGTANCAMGRLEGHRVEILCGGWGGLELPRNSEEIVAFYRGMQGHRPMPEWIFEALEVIFRSEGQETYENIRLPALSRVLYGKVAELPSNFIAIGDSVCRVNPVYGQGHSKCIMGVAVLDSLLRQVPSNVKELPKEFGASFMNLQEQKVCGPIWDSTKTTDYDYDTTIPVKGESLSDGALIRWFSTNVLLASTWDVETSKAFANLRQFVEPPTVLFKPSIVAKVLWEALTHPSARLPVVDSRHA